MARRLSLCSWLAAADARLQCFGAPTPESRAIKATVAFTRSRVCLRLSPLSCRGFARALRGRGWAMAPTLMAQRTPIAGH